jgi:hypothetical protein
MSDNFYKHLDNSDTYYQALEKQNEELEAENAKLKSDLMASEENEAWNLCKAKEFKEERDKLKSELASRGWQSAEKLPEEEGIYAIMTNNGYEWEFRLTACSLQATLMNINVYHARGYEFYDIKYLKLPNVEGK